MIFHLFELWLTHLPFCLLHLLTKKENWHYRIFLWFYMRATLALVSIWRQHWHLMGERILLHCVIKKITFGFVLNENCWSYNWTEDYNLPQIGPSYVLYWGWCIIIHYIIHDHSVLHPDVFWAYRFLEVKDWTV